VEMRRMVLPVLTEFGFRLGSDSRRPLNTFLYLSYRRDLIVARTTRHTCTSSAVSSSTSSRKCQTVALAIASLVVGLPITFGE
jgi:hypothetical protein